MSGRVIWITGLSGAGKSTLAEALAPLLPQPVLILDGDALRAALAPLAGGYERSDRLRLARTYSRLCQLAADQGQTVLCATISMFHEVRQWNRENLPGYFEVFIDPPEAALKQRDYKNVYRRPGEETVIGRDLHPEIPLNPDLHLTDAALDPQQAAELVLASLRGI